jgi:hypothetical protein
VLFISKEALLEERLPAASAYQAHLIRLVKLDEKIIQ